MLYNTGKYFNVCDSGKTVYTSSVIMCALCLKEIEL